MFHLQIVEHDAAAAESGKLVAHASFDGVTSHQLTEKELAELKPLLVKFKRRLKKLMKG